MFDPISTFLTATAVVGLSMWAVICMIAILFVAVLLDYNGRTWFKWFAGAAVTVVIAKQWYASGGTFATFDYTWLLTYAAAGIVYAIVQTFVSLVKQERSIRSMWKDRTSWWSDVSPTTDVDNEMRNAVREICMIHSSHLLVNLTLPPHGVRRDTKPEVALNRGRVVSRMTSWTVFWPLFIITNLIGDLVTELWEVVTTLFAKAFGRFVKRLFSNTFD